MLVSSDRNKTILLRFRSKEYIEEARFKAMLRRLYSKQIQYEMEEKIKALELSNAFYIAENKSLSSKLKSEAEKCEIYKCIHFH